MDGPGVAATQENFFQTQGMLRLRKNYVDILDFRESEIYQRKKPNQLKTMLSKYTCVPDILR